MKRFDAEGARALSAYRSEHSSALSCYLNLDPGTTPTTTALASHVSSFVTGLRRAADEAATTSGHGTATALREDVGRIASFLESELDRSGARGLALFASHEDDLWEEVLLPRPVEDAVYVGRTLVIAPLLDHLEHDRELIVTAVGRDRGVLWQLRQGETTLVEDLSRDGQGQHDQGGWSQARYQRSRDHEALEHMRRVADAIARYVQPGTSTQVVVACTEELRSAFELLLEPPVKQALLGFTTIEKWKSADDLKPEAERLLDERLAAEHAALLDEWREELGQRSGRAVDTWEDALSAAWNGSVETALVDGRNVRSYECPACGRGYATQGTCAVDSTPLQVAVGGALDLVVRGTFVHDGVVRRVSDGLQQTSGVAALPRYAAVPRRLAPVTHRRA